LGWCKCHPLSPRTVTLPGRGGAGTGCVARHLGADRIGLNDVAEGAARPFAAAFFLDVLDPIAAAGLEAAEIRGLDAVGRSIRGADVRRFAAFSLIGKPHQDLGGVDRGGVHARASPTGWRWP